MIAREGVVPGRAGVPYHMQTSLQLKMDGCYDGTSHVFTHFLTYVLDLHFSHGCTHAADPCNTTNALGLLRAVYPGQGSAAVKHAPKRNPTECEEISRRVYAMQDTTPQMR